MPRGVNHDNPSQVPESALKLDPEAETARLKSIKRANKEYIASLSMRELNITRTIPSG